MCDDDKSMDVQGILNQHVVNDMTGINRNYLNDGSTYNVEIGKR